jgi:hypothetical protein
VHYTLCRNLKILLINILVSFEKLQKKPISIDGTLTKAGSSNRQTISQSHTHHVSFLFSTHPPVLQQQAIASSPHPHQHQSYQPSVV